MIYAERSRVKFNLNDFQGAEADCRKALQQDSSNYDMYNTLASIEFNRQNYVQVEKNLNLAIYYKPDFDTAIKNRGLLYLQLGKKTEACRDLQRAIELGNQEALQNSQIYCK